MYIFSINKNNNKAYLINYITFILFISDFNINDHSLRFVKVVRKNTKAVVVGTDPNIRKEKKNIFHYNSHYWPCLRRPFARLHTFTYNRQANHLM